MCKAGPHSLRWVEVNKWIRWTIFHLVVSWKLAVIVCNKRSPLPGWENQTSVAHLSTTVMETKFQLRNKQIIELPLSSAWAVRLNKSAELFSEKYLFFHLRSSRAPTVEFVSQEAELGLFYISHNNRQGRVEQTEQQEEHSWNCGTKREAIFVVVVDDAVVVVAECLSSFWEITLNFKCTPRDAFCCKCELCYY